MRTPPLAVVLIVRDEQDTLPSCLEALRPLQDAGLLGDVHVHDTGSTDATVRIARALGARVTQGEWTGDFAAARNEALAQVDTEWVLSLDADETISVDPAALRTLLATTAYAGLTVEIRNLHDADEHTHAAERLFRRSQVRWQGRVHERLVDDQGPVRLGTVPPSTLELAHTGYATPEIRRGKSERNAALAQADLDALAAQSEPDAGLVAKTLLDLGRSCIGAERPQDAVDAFEAVRELFPGASVAVEATDYLAKVLLAAQMYEPVLVLVGELRAAGAPEQYCNWIEAQARAQLGDVSTAAGLLEGVHELVDSGGRRMGLAQLAQLKSLVALLPR